MDDSAPFPAFAQELSSSASPLRAAITDACYQDERSAVQALLAQTTIDAEEHASSAALARRLVDTLRAQRSHAAGVDALIREFSLSSQEGIALMCLAEALLRIPDRDTADRLIADKIGKGDWRSHIGHSPSLFVNAASWGLLLTGKLVGNHSDYHLAHALTQLIARGGEPLIRTGMDLAMRMLGRQFVAGETIEEALQRSREREARGYRHSYDMLGEAALTAADAHAYYLSYQAAIHAIGKASEGRGIKDASG
ncbi:MAG TPA: proline dehydrogenase family protein, partial [Oxalicibacterium sp.]|nr:proline dehydrogenase family protein [Oxalicibacterium sp.]